MENQYLLQVFAFLVHQGSDARENTDDALYRKTSTRRNLLIGTLIDVNDY